MATITTTFTDDALAVMDDDDLDALVDRLRGEQTRRAVAALAGMGDDTQLFAALSDLDDSDLHSLMRNARAVLAGRETVALADVLREALVERPEPIAEPDLGVVAVAFGTSEYDNGWFFDASSARLTLTDGTVVKDVVLDEAEDHLRELCDPYGPLGRTAGLRVNLLTGQVEADDYMFS